MTSIGLYGDSFTGIPDRHSYKTHWSSLLADRLDANISNYGKGGSSVYFSYRQFLVNHKKHDLNIFLVTEPNRYIKPVEITSGKEIYIPSLFALEVMGRDIHDATLTSLKGWFISSDDTYNNDMSELMIREVRRLDPNCILIPCFATSGTKNIVDVMPMDLNSLQHKQVKYFGIEDPSLAFLNYDENNDLISGHLAPEFNQAVFKIIQHKIETGIWRDSFPETIVSKYKPHEIYIKKEKRQ